MRHSFKIIIVAILIMLPSLSQAQKVYKFGHLNSDEILKTLPDMDSVQVKMQKYVKELQDQLETMQVEYNKKLEEYVKSKDQLNDLIKQSKEKELTTMQQNIQQFQETAQQGMQQKQVELMQPIREKVKKAIADYGKENGFTYIFDMVTGSIAYFSSDSQDITDPVKAKLSPKGNVGAAKPAVPAKK
jgi:outer membrane protein